MKLKKTSIPGNWAEKAKKAVDKYPLVVLFVLIGGLVSYLLAFITLGKEIVNLYQWYNREEIIQKVKTIDEVREEKVNAISAGMPVEKFREILGSPIFILEKQDYFEYTFNSSDAWVQAIAKKDRVVFFATTYCGENLTIRDTPLGFPINLGKTTLAEVGKDHFPNYHYFISGATAPSYIYEGIVGTNPTRYQTTIYGLNDICGLPSNTYEELYDTIHSYDFSDKKFVITNTDMDPDNPVISKYRETTPVNTFGVSDISADMGEIVSLFTLGVDRIQVRTLPTYNVESLNKN